MDAGALSRASSLPSSRPLSSDTPNPTPRPGHRHPSDPPTPSRGSRGSDSDAEVDHDKPRSSAPRNAAFARSISLAVPPSRTPPRPVGPSRPARASGAEPTRHAARGSSPSGASSSATPRGASPPSHAALAAPPVSSHLHAGAMAVAEDSVEAELVAWEAAMDGPTRRAVLGNVLPYLYTYRAKLGCEEAAAHVRAKLGELSRVHDMDLRAVMAGGGDNAGVGVGDSAGRDASLMTTPSTSESGSLVPEDDRLAQWMAGARQGWAVLVDTALCKVLTESQQGGMWGDANGGSGAVGKGDESGGGGGGGGGGRRGVGGRDSGGDEKSGGGDWTRGGATGAAIDAPSAVLVDFCRGRHCVHPSEAFEFLARRGDYAPLLDVLQSQGLHAQALSALRVLACAPDTGPDSALTPPAPGSTGLVGPGAVRKTVEYCRETPGLEVGVVEGVCAWVFGRDVEAGLQARGGVIGWERGMSCLVFCVVNWLCFCCNCYPYSLVTALLPLPRHPSTVINHSHLPTSHFHAPLSTAADPPGPRPAAAPIPGRPPPGAPESARRAVPVSRPGHRCWPGHTGRLGPATGRVIHRVSAEGRGDREVPRWAREGARGRGW